MPNGQKSPNEEIQAENKLEQEEIELHAELANLDLTQLNKIIEFKPDVKDPNSIKTYLQQFDALGNAKLDSLDADGLHWALLLLKATAIDAYLIKWAEKAPRETVNNFLKSKNYQSLGLTGLNDVETQFMQNFHRKNEITERIRAQIKTPKIEAPEVKAPEVQIPQPLSPPLSTENKTEALNEGTLLNFFDHLIDDELHAISLNDALCKYILSLKSFPNAQTLSAQQILKVRQEAIDSYLIRQIKKETRVSFMRKQGPLEKLKSGGYERARKQYKLSDDTVDLIGSNKLNPRVLDALSTQLKQLRSAASPELARGSLSKGKFQPDFAPIEEKKSSSSRTSPQAEEKSPPAKTKIELSEGGKHLKELLNTMTQADLSEFASSNRGFHKILTNNKYMSQAVKSRFTSDDILELRRIALDMYLIKSIKIKQNHDLIDKFYKANAYPIDILKQFNLSQEHADLMQSLDHRRLLRDAIVRQNELILPKPKASAVPAESKAMFSEDVERINEILILLEPSELYKISRSTKQFWISIKNFSTEENYKNLEKNLSPEDVQELRMRAVDLFLINKINESKDYEQIKKFDQADNYSFDNIKQFGLSKEHADLMSNRRYRTALYNSIGVRLQKLRPVPPQASSSSPAVKASSSAPEITPPEIKEKKREVYYLKELERELAVAVHGMNVFELTMLSGSDLGFMQILEINNRKLYDKYIANRANLPEVTTNLRREAVDFVILHKLRNTASLDPIQKFKDTNNYELENIKKFGLTKDHAELMKGKAHSDTLKKYLTIRLNPEKQAEESLSDSPPLFSGLEPSVAESEEANTRGRRSALPHNRSSTREVRIESPDKKHSDNASPPRSPARSVSPPPEHKTPRAEHRDRSPELRHRSAHRDRSPEPRPRSEYRDRSPEPRHRSEYRDRSPEPRPRSEYRDRSPEPRPRSEHRDRSPQRRSGAELREGRPRSRPPVQDSRGRSRERVSSPPHPPRRDRSVDVAPPRRRSVSPQRPLRRDPVRPSHRARSLPARIRSINDLFDDIKFNLRNLNQTELAKIINATVTSCPKELTSLETQLGINLDRYVGRPANPINRLNDDGLKKLQQYAVDHYLIKQINKSTDIGLLEGFLNTRGYADAAELGLSQHAVQLMGNLNRFNEVDEALENRIYTLKANEVFKQKVDQMAANKALKLSFQTRDGLEMRIEDLMGRGNPKNRDIDRAYAREVLADRCLKASLEKMNATDLLNVVRAEDNEGLRREPSFRSFYLPASNKQNWGVKASALQAAIGKMTNTNSELNSLSKPTTFAQFKQVAGQLRFGALNELNNLSEAEGTAFAQSIQQAARTRRFELLTNEGRPDLVKMLSELPVKKQMDLLNQPEPITKVMQATNSEQIRDLLQLDSQTVIKGVDQVVTERDERELYKSIHNAVIAKILSDLRPPIKLDERRVNSINEAINSTELRDERSYVNLVEDLGYICKIPSAARFFKAFGLNQSGTRVVPPAAGAQGPYDLITAQHQYNENLRDAWHSRRYTEAEEQFLGLFLNMSKDFAFTQAMIADLMPSFAEAFSYDNFFDRFLQSPSVTQRFTTPQQLNELKTKITNQISSDTFSEIKKRNNAEYIEGDNPAMRRRRIDHEAIASREIDHIDNQITSRAINRVELQEMITEANPVLKVKPIHFSSPLFQGRLKEQNAQALQQEASLKELSEKCALGIDYLRRHHDELKQYLLSKNLPDSSNPRHQDRIERIRAKIIRQQNDIVKDVRKLQKLQRHLDGDEGILKAMEKAKTGGMDYILKVRGFDAPRDVINPPESDSSVIAGVRSASKGTTSSEFLTASKLEAGQTRIYPFKGNVGALQERIGSKGREFYIKPPDGKFPDNEDQRVQYAMEWAAIVLSSRKKAPTSAKPLELFGTDPVALQYLYEALKRTGELGTSMQFPANAIKYDASVFQPNPQIAAKFTAAAARATVTGVESQFTRGMEEKKEEHIDAGATAAAQANTKITQEFRDAMQDKRNTKGAAPEIKGKELQSPNPPAGRGSGPSSAIKSSFLRDKHNFNNRTAPQGSQAQNRDNHSSSPSPRRGG